MGLKFTTGKGEVTFACDDGLVEATVRLKQSDDEAVVIAKLERVLSLLRKQQEAEPPTSPTWQARDVVAQPGPAEPLPRRPFTGVPPVQPPPLADSVAHAQANGWEMYNPDELEEA